MAATRVGDRSAAERVAFGSYDLLQLVAATRLGGVHRGESNEASKPRAPLAIKWLKPEHSRDPAIAACFTDVMARTRRLEHAGVCAIVDVDRAPDESLFTALEWVNGKDWKRIVAALKKQGTTMPPTLVAYVGMRVAQALEAAHRPSPNRQLAPLYHGELSGADILIGYDGRVKLSGLGSAELAEAARLPAVRTAFRAPELARGAAVGAQSDVFSLGACLYQALTLTAQQTRHTSDAEAVEKPSSMIRHIVPAPLLEIVRKAVAEDPDVRFASAGALATALAHWASTQSSPGDARALAVFMTSMFEQTRSGPMNDPRDNTPAQPLRARKLAAVMRSPAPEESVETTPVPIAPVGNPLVAAAEPTVAKEAEPLASATEPLASVAEPAAVPAPSPADESWESEPWENAHEAESAWSVTPAAPPVITTRPPGRPTPRAPSPVPAPPRTQAVAAQVAAPPRTQAVAAQVVAPARTQAVAAQVVTPPLPSVALHVEAPFAQLAASSRTAWRVPAFVAASVVLVLGVLFALRAPAPVTEPPSVAAAPTLSSAQRVEPVAPAPAPSAPPADPASTVGDAAHVAAPPARAARVPAADSGAREARHLPRAQPAAVRGDEGNDDAKDEPSAVRSDPVEAPPTAAPTETWTPPTRTAIAATPTPLPAATPAPAPVSVTETPVARPPQSAPKTTVVRTAEVIAQPAPDFPTRAKRRGVTEGTVTVEYTVDETGAVRDPRVTESLPKGLFDEATLDALSRWRYRPKLVDGKPVASRRAFTFHFE